MTTVSTWVKGNVGIEMFNQGCLTVKNANANGVGIEWFALRTICNAQFKVIAYLQFVYLKPSFLY